ncbi:MAG: hypothetical protein II852_07300 [Bacteroidales bacterium]|nr:hypothetical protein [Bacteroidales bacterium]
MISIIFVILLVVGAFVAVMWSVTKEYSNRQGTDKPISSNSVVSLVLGLMSVVLCVQTSALAFSLVHLKFKISDYNIGDYFMSSYREIMLPYITLSFVFLLVFTIVGTIKGFNGRSVDKSRISTIGIVINLVFLIISFCSILLFGVSYVHYS